MSREASRNGKGSKKSIYLSKKINDSIALGGEDTLSGRVSHLISVADALVSEHCPALTASEWCAIANALNGHWPSYEQGPKSVFGSAWHSLYDSAPEADAMYDVDCKALAHKLQAMPLAAQHAVFEVAAKRFWSRPAVVEAAGNYAAAFRALGAKVRPNS